MKEELTWTDEADIERARLRAAREELELTDTDRINALITLFGGHYAFPVMWQVSELFSNGRVGLDAFLFNNPSLLKKEQ